MSYLLQVPTTVLVVDAAGALSDEVRSVVLSGTATAIDVVSTTDGAREAVADRDDIGCVLVTSTGTDRSTAEVCDAVHDEAPKLPVIAYVEDAGGAVAAELAGRTHCRYLPREASDSALRTAVGDSLRAFDRRRREEAESSLFRTLLTESNVPIFAKDDEGRHLYKSDLKHSQPRSDYVGKTDLDLSGMDGEGMDDEGAKRAYEDDMEVVETGQGIYDQVEQSTRDDGEYWSQVTKVPWRDDGEIQGLVGIAFGINWWKERERQLEAQKRRVDQFASYLRHDLRTPLQVAYGALELAREGDDDAFEKVERAHERMLDVVDDLSGLSGGTGSANYSDEAYDAFGLGIKSIYLVPMIEDLWAVYGPPEGTLTIELPADTVVVAQSGTVRPLVENLLKNAVEHGGSDVTVRVGSTGDNSFFIEDDGPGMPADLATAISEHDIDRTERLAGTGFLIVLDAVEKLGWDIDVTDVGAGGLTDEATETGQADRTRGTRIVLSECTIIPSTPASLTPTDTVEISSQVDVGPVPIPGDATYDAESDRWSVTGSGENIWGDTNEFHFVYGTATAPVRIEGRVDRLDGVHAFSKAGFAIRAGLDENAPFGYVGTTESHGSEVTWRFATDGHTDSDQFEERQLAFEWYRVDYVDGKITCYLSEDGEDWHPVDQQPIDLGEEVHAGMLVSSHNSDRSCEAAFRNVRAWKLNG